MNGKKNETGGHAFPPGVAATPGSGFRSGESGMTLRDWFAGQALSGMLADEGEAGFKAQTAAARSYEMADAMLSERAK